MKMAFDKSRAKVSMPVIVETPHTRHETASIEHSSTAKNSLTEVTVATILCFPNVNNRNTGGTLCFKSFIILQKCPLF